MSFLPLHGWENPERSAPNRHQMVVIFTKAEPLLAQPSEYPCNDLVGFSAGLFIYLLSIQLGARRLWPIEGNKHQQKQQNRYTKTGAQTRQRKSSTGPPPAPIHPCSVVQKVVVMPPLRDIVVGFAFYIGLRGPGRVPGFSSWSSPIPPPLSHELQPVILNSLLHLKCKQWRVTRGLCPGCSG